MESTASQQPPPLSPVQHQASWIDYLPDPAMVIDPFRDHVLSANIRLARLLGTSRAQILARSVSTFFGSQLPQLITFTEEAMINGQCWSRDFTIEGPRGRLIALELSMARMDTDPGASHLLVYLRNLDQLQEQREKHEINTYHQGGLLHWRRIETLFRDIERENHLILEAVGEGIYGVDAEGRTTFINSAGERLLGFERDELLGRVVHQVVHHTHADGRPHKLEECPIYRAFKDGAVHRVSDDCFWRKDGSQLPVEYTSTPIMDNGQLIGAVVVFRDVSERKQAERELTTALTQVEALKQKLEMENAYLQEELSAEHRDHEIVGRSDVIKSLIRRIDLVAPTDANVLISGESGTGKELIARAIQTASQRRERPLIRVNCAAIPADLFESEFFGHIRGAFTGAVNDRVGRFELADGGTLFLDEVGEIPMELQGKLLRVLQDQQFERVGDTRTRKVDVRVIAATNRNLKAEADAGRFRKDLYFRLNVFPIESMPLRERPEDIPLLAQLFLEHACRKFNRHGLSLTLADVDALQSYHWPGNIRELENVIERQVIVATGKRLRFDLPQTAETVEAMPEQPLRQGVTGQPLTEQEKRQQDRDNLICALRQTRGKVSGPGGAAELLGLKPTTLASRIRKYRIDPASFR
ncbi:MAG: PAS domain S-box protein [Halomonadaceae bacterium]|nr:MAG: PAS domain S-box protein [Halomonadaceae bacterium]